MAKRITEKDIEIINEAYLICKTYSGAAKAAGCSPSTARKYIIPGYVSKGVVGKIPSKQVHVEPAAIDEAMNYLLSHTGLSCLTEQEKKDLKEIWKGMMF